MSTIDWERTKCLVHKHVDFSRALNENVICESCNVLQERVDNIFTM